MKIKYMRNIDFWVGIPLCFFLSLKNRKNRKNRDSDRFSATVPIFKKLLFIELSEMGSAILAYPAMKKAKELFPEIELYFWIFKRNRESIDVLGGIVPIGNVIIIRDDNLFVMVKDIVLSLSRLWKERIDIVIDMELFSRISAILSYLSKAKLKIGFYRFCQEGLYRGNLQDIKVQYNPHLHISANFMALIQAINSEEADILLKEAIDESEIKLPLIKPNKESKERMLSIIRDVKQGFDNKARVIILNPIGGELLPIRNWPVQNYIMLTERLLVDTNNTVVMIGLEADTEKRDIISDLSKKERCIDMIGKTSLTDLISLFSISDLFISHDSGPVHFASLTGISMIVLFGPETPVCYGPLSPNVRVLSAGFACSPCLFAYNHRLSPCRDNKCLKALSVDDVYNLAVKMFKK